MLAVRRHERELRARGLTRLALFGSTARGEAGPNSDVDLLAAFDAAGCSGWGRVDVMRDRAGRNYLLEVNTAPGMTSHSLVPKAAGTFGIPFEDLCWRVLETSLPQEAARA